MIAVAALAFVGLCLVALAVTPVLMTRQLDAIREHTTQTTQVADSLLGRLRVLIAEEVVQHQLARLSTPATSEQAFARYWAFRQEEARVVWQLRKLAPSVSPEAGRSFHSLEDAADRWHAAFDARASARMTEDEFAAQLPSAVPLRAALLAAHSEYLSAVSVVERQNMAEATRAVTAQRRVSLGLGTLAALALILVGWLAYRERAVAIALAKAVRTEARLRAEAVRNREDLLRVSESKSRLVRGFTHDVKNPIGAADGYLQLVEGGDLGPVTEQQRAGLYRARGSIRTALTLIADLLEVSRADAGHLRVERAPTDVTRIARSVAEEYRAQAEQKGLTLTVQAETVPKIETDHVRVRQIVSNLVSNAVKYTTTGAVTVRVAVRGSHRVHDAEEFVVVEVEDTGPGISSEKRRLLFQEFSRLDPSAAPGVGLGLAMSCRIAEALNADLSVHSEPGRGSTFTLALPLASAKAESEAAD